jgi:hypothetical protein
VAYADVVAPGAVADFNVLSWRFAAHGPDAVAAQRRSAGPGRWTVVAERVEPTETGYAVELTHESGGLYFRTLTLVTVADGLIAAFVHYLHRRLGRRDAAAAA